MTHDLFSSLNTFAAVSSVSSSLMICDSMGDYRVANDDEVLKAAQLVLAARVKGSAVMDSPSVVRDFLRARMGGLPYEIFAVLHLDSQHRVIDYVEMFRGTVSQTSVYPREVVKDAMNKNSSALILAHNHPSGSAAPSRADEMLTQALKSACAMVDVKVLDHVVVGGDTIVSMAEKGLM